MIFFYINTISPWDETTSINRGPPCVCACKKDHIGTSFSSSFVSIILAPVTVSVTR